MTANYTWERVEAGWYVCCRVPAMAVVKDFDGWWVSPKGWFHKGPFKSKKAAIERAEDIIARRQA